MFKKRALQDIKRNEFIQKYCWMYSNINKVQDERNQSITYMRIDDKIVGIKINNLDNISNQNIQDQDFDNIELNHLKVLDLNFGVIRLTNDIIKYNNIEMLTINNHFFRLNKDILHCFTNLAVLEIEFGNKQLMETMLIRDRVMLNFNKLEELKINDFLTFYLESNCFPDNLKKLKITMNWQENMDIINMKLQNELYSKNIYPESLQFLNIHFYTNNNNNDKINLPIDYLPKNLIELMILGNINPISIPKNIKSLILSCTHNIFKMKNDNGTKIELKNYLNNSLEKLELIVIDRTSYTDEEFNELINNPIQKKLIIKKDDLPDSLRVLEIGGDVEIESINPNIKVLHLKEFLTYFNEFDYENIELDELILEFGYDLETENTEWLNIMYEMIKNTKCKKLKLPIMKITKEFMEKLIELNNIMEINFELTFMNELENEYLENLIVHVFPKRMNKLILDVDTLKDKNYLINKETVKLYEEVLLYSRNNVEIYRKDELFILDVGSMLFFKKFLHNYLEVNYEILNEIYEEYPDKVYDSELLNKICSPKNYFKYLSMGYEHEDIQDWIGLALNP